VLFLVIASGAFVRLTGSGLGCENWPSCGDRPYPEQGFHAFVEFGNRMVALVGIVMTLVTLVASRRAVGLSGWGRWAALGAFLVAVAQIPMGGITIALDLHPLAVMTHFLLGLTAFGLALVAALEAWSLRDGLAVPAGALWLRLLVTCVGLPTCIALVVTGAVATASGPHPGSSEDVERLGLGIVDTVYVTFASLRPSGSACSSSAGSSASSRAATRACSDLGGSCSSCSSRRRSWARCSTATRCRGGSSSSTSHSRRRSGHSASASRSSLWRPPAPLTRQ
jgi:hypothetical protein